MQAGTFPRGEEGKEISPDKSYGALSSEPPGLSFNEEKEKARASGVSHTRSHFYHNQWELARQTY